MCDKIKVFKLYLNTVLTKVIAIVFVFENFIVFVIVFKYYAMHLDPSLTTAVANAKVTDKCFKRHGQWRSENAKDGYILEI